MPQRSLSMIFSVAVNQNTLPLQFAIKKCSLWISTQTSCGIADDRTGNSEHLRFIAKSNLSTNHILKPTETVQFDVISIFFIQIGIICKKNENLSITSKVHVGDWSSVARPN